MSEYHMADTKRPDGVYVKWVRVEKPDPDASPLDYLFQDKEYRDQDQARLDAFRDGAWHFIGIQAAAHLYIVRNGVSTHYQFNSPGLWGIESDSEPSYLESVFSDEKDVVMNDLRYMAGKIDGSPEIEEIQ